MQSQPDAEALLDAVAELLEHEVIESVPAQLRHRVRVAAHLCRIVQREVELAEQHDHIERDRLASLGFDGADLRSARHSLVERLNSLHPLDDEVSVHGALLATVAADLSIAKPGYDS